MLDFILKPGRKLEYYENASPSKSEGNSSIDTCRKSCWKFVCAQRIWPARKCQPHARVILTHVIENDVNVCKQISSLYERIQPFSVLRDLKLKYFRGKPRRVLSVKWTSDWARLAWIRFRSLLISTTMKQCLYILNRGGNNDRAI